MAVLVVPDAVKQIAAPDLSGSAFAVEGAAHSYRLLVELMEQGVAVVDHDGSVRYCNPYLARLLRRPVHNVIGATVNALGGSR